MLNIITLSFIMVFFCIGNTSLVFAQTPVEEQIYGVEMTEKGPVFQVYSGGCTDKDDFDVEVLHTNPVLLRLLRLTPDYCKAYYPYGIKINFNFDELGLAPFSYFTVVNPRMVVQVVTEEDCD